MVEPLAVLKRLHALGLCSKVTQHHEAESAHAERAATGVMCAVEQGKVAVDVHPIVREEVIEMRTLQQSATFQSPPAPKEGHRPWRSPSGGAASQSPRPAR